MKKSALWIGALLILLGLVLTAGALFAVGFDLSEFGGETVTAKTYEVDDAFKRIEINVKETDVVLRPSENKRCSVVCDERENMKLAVYVENGTLKVFQNDRRKWTDYLTLFSKPKSMTVWLPTDSFEALSLNCGTGDVLLSDGVSCESAAITTSTGDIRISDVRADEVTLTVSTGDVALKNLIVSGSLSVKSSTGDVRFDGCDAGAISVKCTTGDVTGTLRTNKAFRVKTSTGKVDVPETTSGGICEITTSTGDIRISCVP